MGASADKSGTFRQRKRRTIAEGLMRGNRTILTTVLLAYGLLFFPVKVAAQDLSATDAGFQHFYNLEYDEALASFHAEVAKNPTSPEAMNHVAQTILYRQMFRAGTLESQMVTGNNPFLRRAEMKIGAADEKEFLDSIERALALCDARLQQHPDDIPALYAQGVSYGLRANYHFLVHKAWIDALKDVTASRKAHHRVTELDPNNVDARLVQGVYDYVVGSLTPLWRTLGFLAGYVGDRNRGIETLQMVAEKGKINRTDAAVILCAILRRERRPKETVPYLLDLIDKYPRNFLLRLELVQMYGEFGERDKALAVISQLEQMKKNHASGFERIPEETIQYTRGNLLFWYNDLDRALADIKAVTTRAGAIDLNTGVYAWLRLGQIYDLKGNRKEAVHAYNQTMVFAPGSDAANEAMGYALNKYKRQPDKNQ
jgi:tetratricopeptide (TPR) repeat protein